MSTDHRITRQQLQSQIATLKSTVGALERRLEEMEGVPCHGYDERLAAPEVTRATAAEEVQLAIAAG